MAWEGGGQGAGRIVQEYRREEGGRDAEEEEEGSRGSAQEKTRSEVVDHSGALEFNRGRRLGKEKGGRG